MILAAAPRPSIDLRSCRTMVPPAVIKPLALASDYRPGCWRNFPKISKPILKYESEHGELEHKCYDRGASGCDVESGRRRVWRCGEHVCCNPMTPRRCESVIHHHHVPKERRASLGATVLYLQITAQPSLCICVLSLTATDLWSKLVAICETCERLGLGNGLTAKERLGIRWIAIHPLI